MQIALRRRAQVSGERVPPVVYGYPEQLIDNLVKRFWQSVLGAVIVFAGIGVCKAFEWIMNKLWP